MTRVAWVPPRPQSVAEVLDTMFRIFLGTVVKSLPYGLAAMLIVQLPNLYDLGRGAPLRGFGANDAVWWLLFAVGTLGTLAFWSSIMLRQTAMLRGEPLSARRELARTMRMLPALVALFVLVIAAIVVGTAALLVPGLYLAVALTLAWPALVLDGIGPAQALRESIRLTRGSWLHVAAVLTVSVVVMMALVLAVTIAVVALPLAGAADVALATALAAAIFIAMGAIAAPFYGALLIALYGNLQARRNGADLERRVASLPGA
jgi:hypothetical protein